MPSAGIRCQPQTATLSPIYNSPGHIACTYETKKYCNSSESAPCSSLFGQITDRYALLSLFSQIASHPPSHTQGGSVV